ncbi:DNA polymerase III subunit delta [Campylobacter pinnipediorum]|uniref:DNA polymerase III subunit delta n=1 Tax=Campylobacter pinnipediorum TaxID=1965231 RepID=UPI00084DC1CB|nr:DNA polymerase III subunit delta [Campylobacter pinnipediorum]AQW81839.1 DNA polymerase III, delta subunit [Campylobacter pinnipediorum subsp. pinnipediorum]
MYKKELDTLLETKKINNFFLLFGAEEYQIQDYTEEILSIFINEDTNLLTLYFDEYEFKTAINHLSEPSLFASQNILHIKTDKKIPTKDLKALISLCKDNQDNKFILELYESDTKITSEISKVFGTNFVRFFKPNTPDEAINILAKTSRKIGLNITKNALYDIYFIHNENLYLAASELNKLSSLNLHIDQEIVKKLVFSLSSIGFDEFFNKLFNLQDIKNDFFQIEQSPSFNEIALINSFYKLFFRLFKLHSYIKINGKFDIKEAIGYKPPINIENTLKQQSLMLNLKNYEEIFKALNLAELELKTNSSIDKSAFLISMILNLQNIISKAKFK